MISKALFVECTTCITYVWEPGRLLCEAETHGRPEVGSAQGEEETSALTWEESELETGRKGSDIFSSRGRLPKHL